MSCEASGAKKDTTKVDKEKLKPYVIPSKIQKSEGGIQAMRESWHDPLHSRNQLRYARTSKFPSFTLRELSESKANASKFESSKTRHPSSEIIRPSPRFGSAQSSSLVQNRNLFKFGESSPNNAAASSSSSASGINFNFKTENSNAQDGFKLLNAQNESTTSTSGTSGASTSKKFTYGPNMMQLVTQDELEAAPTQDVAASTSMKFSFGPKASDR